MTAFSVLPAGRDAAPLGTPGPSRRAPSGTVAVGEAAVEAARHRALPTGAVANELRRVPTVREALSWARFPVVSAKLLDASGRRITIADLRYHLAGKPTLAFVIDVGPDGSVQNARLDRGGSAGELLRRFRESR